jgi:predicted MFS family arabinose efflux permease
MIKKEDLPAIVVGIMATLAGIGIARFAYTPLLPELVQQGWFSGGQAAYLGAANLLGYLIGALSAFRLSESFAPSSVIRLCLVSICLSFIFCAQPNSFEWFFIWRFIAGAAGAILMVVGPAEALACTPLSRRTSVGTLVFIGIGLGAVISAITVPLLLQINLFITWISLGGIIILIGILCHFALKNLPNKALKNDLSSEQTTANHKTKTIVFLLIAAYALDAVGFIPHTVFWADYVARELGLGINIASTQWLVFGIGAMLGPIFVGITAHKVGLSYALLIAFLFKAVAVFLPTLSDSLIILTISSFIVGALVPGIVALASGRIAELVGARKHKQYWGLATATFAIAQAISGYSMSLIYNLWESYIYLFYIGSTAIVCGYFLLFIGEIVIAKKNQNKINPQHLMR